MFPNHVTRVPLIAGSEAFALAAASIRFGRVRHVIDRRGAGYVELRFRIEGSRSSNGMKGDRRVARSELRHSRRTSEQNLDHLVGMEVECGCTSAARCGTLLVLASA